MTAKIVPISYNTYYWHFVNLSSGVPLCAVRSISGLAVSPFPVVPVRLTRSTSPRLVAVASVCNGMPCYHPRLAWRNPAGVVSLREPRTETPQGTQVLRIPCGGCIGCSVRQARDWAVRCNLEASAHEEASFVTLTYDDEHLPAGGVLQRDHLSGYLKRLRARLGTRRIKFFACGEYGEQTKRPHYHALLFGVSDCPPVRGAWTAGFVEVAPLTPERISYVAGYVGKKISDRTFLPRIEWYWRDDWHAKNSGIAELQRVGSEWVNAETGEVPMGPLWPRQRARKVIDPRAPFRLMSRRPGIGGDARRFWRSWRESAVFRGNEVPVPRFLHAAYKLMASEEEYADLEAKKLRDMAGRDMSRDRLRAGEEITRAHLSILNEGRTL